MSVAGGDEAISSPSPTLAPSTSTSPPSSLPNPPPDSMEEADRDHKRRRLNSESKQDTDAVAMSTDQSVPDSPAVPALTLDPAEQHLQMTIRSQPPSSSNPQDQDQDYDHDPDDAATSDYQVPSSDPGDDDTHISTLGGGDAAADSPPVIAIPDDDEDEDDTELMVDCTAPASLHIQYDAESYFERFPFTKDGNYMLALSNVAAHLHGGGPIDGSVIPQIAVWLYNFPDQPLQYKSFFTDKAQFWDEFVTIMTRILGRRTTFGEEFSDDNHSEENVCISFFTAYLRICVRLFQADAEMLSHWTSPEPCPLPIVASKHVRQAYCIIRPEKSSVFHLLNKEYGADISDMADQFLRAFLQVGGLKHLLHFADQACNKTSAIVLNTIAVSTAPLLDAVGWALFATPTLEHSTERPQLYQEMLHFFRQYNEHLQMPGKVVDTAIAKDLITHFSSLLLHLCQWDTGIATELVDHMLDFQDPESPTTTTMPTEPSQDNSDVYRQDPTLYPVLIHNAWKFKLLRKYIVKGRMELRVTSIGAMDRALVDIWREYNVHPYFVKHPVMQYLADFLLHQKVVNYIISVDSHPQLISRSGNIVGFLVVTLRYSEGETDAIWNTVANSSDPRVVSATMTMLRSIIGLMNPPELLYLSTKIFDLPIENCTLDIVQFQREITNKLLNLDWSRTEFKSRPWNVSIRILQDTSPTKDLSKSLMSLHAEAAEQLRASMIYTGPEERYEIYQQCAKHIESRSPKATGSVHAIFILAHSFAPHDSLFFENHPQWTRHILEEMCAYVGDKDGLAFNTPQNYAVLYRLELLCLFIHRTTAAIPSDLYETIWDHFIGKYAHSNHLRNMAWAKFSQAMSLRPGNQFCQALISTHVPKLDPQCYTTGLFEFVAAYNFSTEKQIVETDDGEKELLQIRGAHLLWPMILSAPPHTIEDRTATLLAARYLELDPMHGVTLPDMEAAHTALVEKCIHEILSSYKLLREQPTNSSDEMDINPTGSLRQQNERRLTRTVLFLKLLLQSIRTRADFNRSRRADSKVEPLEDEDLPDGDVVEIRYQSGSDEKQSIVMGQSNTMQDVYRRLCHATGYSKVNIFHKGRRIELEKDGSKTVADLDLGTQNLQVQKAQGSEINYPVASTFGACSVFETTILNRFEELFACMDSEDAISATLYEFLVQLPFQERIFKSVTAGTISVADLFPPERHFQAKYAAHALHWKLEQQLRSTVDEQYLANAVRVLDQALLNPALVIDASSPSHVELAGVLVQVLLKFLKGPERPSTEVSSSYFSNGNLLVERLLDLVSVSVSAENNISPYFALNAYATIVEASLHSRGVWDAFLNSDKVLALHKKLLLDDARKEMREGITKVMSSVCGGGLSPSSALTEVDTAICFWKMISPVLPYTVEQPGRSEQIFVLADEVFRKHDENNRDEVSLRSYLSTWSEVLLSYRHDEEVGRGEIDFVVLGFSKLLLSCISSLKSFKKPLNAGQLVERLWNKFLFVPKIVELDDETPSQETPVLESNTRRQLLDLVLSLAEDRNSYNKVLDLAENLGITEAEMQMRLSFDVDRDDAIRSPTGYLGLNNPRAICYMNSLLAQLFMNVNFRKFMLGLDVAEPAASQRLLHETQALFSMMQNSYRKFADPQNFAACVRVPDGGSIDINVQMDADEFYNLLFDQWEAQMLSPEVKERFRSFYGGQTVNQIKSKECEHVSERLESFFVVQCDVQGKSNLHESLQAFVEGDVMEGENKYKCESCGGRLVDAVKRTCLKEVPDNLIFHLKRFDFDLVTLSRAKINDHFDFPMNIDVSPYKVDHLSDPTQPCEEDWFELVGVLVHQGSSEAGHYYSYIRTRPDLAENVARWSEFNDRDVDAFDPQYIPARAYGGWDDKFHRQLKNYSAYMLFYQRRSAISKDRTEYMDSLQYGNVKVPVPSTMGREIKIDNDNCIREYCMYDPYHTKFLRQILSNLRTVNRGICSEDHTQETQALHIMLEHLFQVHIRVRNPDNFDETLLQVRKTVLSCSTCCLVAMRWLANNDSALLNMLILCEASKIRSQSRAFLIDCLRFLRDREPVAYGIECMEMDNDTGAAVVPQDILSTIVAQLRIVAENSYFAVRSWDDFYLTLCQISDLGHVETAALLNEGLLKFCLQVLCMPAVPLLQHRNQAMWRVIEKRRRIYNRMVEFVYTLLSKIDLQLPTTPDARIAGTNRLDVYDRSSSKFPISHEERHLLQIWHDDNRAYAALDRMLEMFDVTKTEVFYPGEILRLLLHEPDLRFQSHLYTTVYEGVCQLKPPSQDPYVRAALPYCQTSSDVHSVYQVYDVIAKLSGNCLKHGGQAHVQFFNGVLHSQNNAVFEEKGEDAFYRLSLTHARRTLMPLLMNEEEIVRNLAAKHFRDLFLEWESDNAIHQDTLKLKYKQLRIIVSDLQRKIEDEHRNGTPRSYMQPMITTCGMLMESLYKLNEADEPLFNQLRVDSDMDLITRQADLEASLRNWAFDEETPQSLAEGFDQSDYGSESDVDPDAFDV
ncbi:hypothetical protein DM02DRAFT_657374 [Periconia macrospinosa]|uniref:USP domain-containing protein n=1 Tax=Periconia macrospinosa TaxID=97972 RepID=A0A2V1DK20_9PLEO|nr:hypothetical protein DM02DRAFT_657374 [Periconia macrospinosa]